MVFFKAQSHCSEQLRLLNFPMNVQIFATDVRGVPHSTSMACNMAARGCISYFGWRVRCTGPGKTLSGYIVTKAQGPSHQDGVHQHIGRHLCSLMLPSALSTFCAK